MTRELKCHTGVGQKVTGIALVADDNFSARYDLDRIKGVFSRPQHKLAGQSYKDKILVLNTCLLYTSPSPRDGLLSRMPSSA